jgi:hypothetical protein
LNDALVQDRDRRVSLAPKGENRSNFGVKLAERAGFEPAVRVSPDARLASEYLRPLGHLSVPTKERRTLHQTAESANGMRAQARARSRRARSVDQKLGGAGTMTEPRFKMNGWPRQSTRIEHQAAIQKPNARYVRTISSGA